MIATVATISQKESATCPPTLGLRVKGENRQRASQSHEGVRAPSPPGGASPEEGKEAGETTREQTVIQFSRPTLCDRMDYSVPGFPVLHHLPELAQTHVH